MKRRTLALIVAVAFAALVAVAGVVGIATVTAEDESHASGEGPYRGSEPPGRHPLPRFSLRNYDGTPVRSADLRGKVVLLTFLDSQCTDACPIIAARIGRTVDRLTVEERRQIAAVAISTEPAEDTPASVRSFLRNQRALGKLLYVSGPERDMRPLWKRFQILSSLESGEDTLHSAPVRIYDRDSLWVATLHATVDLSEDNLLHDLRVALEQPG